MNNVGCHTHIWIHHLNKKEIKILHRRHRKQHKSSTIELLLSECKGNITTNNNILFKNHTGCDDWDYGIPKPKPKRLAAMDIKYGISKTKIRFKKVDFTNGSTPACAW